MNFKEGKRWEAAAEKYMNSMGYTTLEKRWRRREGECDLVMCRREKLAFIEVKYRALRSQVQEAWRLSQRKRLVRLAQSYETAESFSEVALGFIGLYSAGSTTRLQHYWVDWRDLN